MEMVIDKCKITKEEVKLAVKKQVKGKQFQLVDFVIKPASEEPLGFLGDHVRIEASIVIDGQDQLMKYFAKKIPTKVKSHREYAEGTRAFYKEIELYKTLFDDIENAISPKRREQAKWRPACYYTRDWDLLIGEDLTPQGFYMLPERSLMPLEYMNATVRVLAKMHSGSIIFEEKLNNGQCTTHSPNYSASEQKVTIRDLYANLIFESECTDKEGHPGYAFWEAGISGQTALVDELPEYSPEEKAKIKQKFPDTLRQIYRMLEPSEKYRNVMIHADLWGNNLMFLNIDGGNPETVLALTVDYQMTRYAPPAQDLMMFLHTMQDRAFRAIYEVDLVDLYYECLKQELGEESLDIKIILPRGEFDESCAFYKRYAILNQIINTQLTITPPAICGKTLPTSEDYNRIMYEDRSDILIESFRTDEICRTRAAECIVEIVDTFNLL